MDKKQFIYDASQYIFKEVAKGVNQLCGLSKTSSMIANLLVNLPLQVEARFSEDMPKPFQKYILHFSIQTKSISKEL